MPSFVATGSLEQLEHQSIRELEDQISRIVSYLRILDDPGKEDRLRLLASINWRRSAELVPMILARNPDPPGLNKPPEHRGGDGSSVENEDPRELLAMDRAAMATDKP
jgi:hypothetical protein